jgi:hypothetical protein
MKFRLIHLLLLSLAACSGSSEEQKKRIKNPDIKDQAANNKDTNNDSSSGDQSVSPAPVPENEIHPKLLFHGGGGMSGLMPSTIDMRPAAKILTNLGVPSEQIHLIQYPHTKNISDIKAAVDSQLKTIFAKYPSNTKFDSIGHSLGLLASFISLAELGHLPKIRSIIGVAGVAMRQDDKAMPMGCTKGSTKDLCGDIFDKVVGPSDSVYVLDLLSKNAADMARINKCAVWSAKDGVLSPPNAGVFPGGKSVQMPSSWCPMGNMLNPCHLQAKSSTAVYEAMKAQCFGGDFK